MRENRRIKMAVQTTKLSAIKTLAGFNFAFQPSLDKNRVLAFAGHFDHERRGAQFFKSLVTIKPPSVRLEDPLP